MATYKPALSSDSEGNGATAIMAQQMRGSAHARTPPLLQMPEQRLTRDSYASHSRSGHMVKPAIPILDCCLLLTFCDTLKKKKKY